MFGYVKTDYPNMFVKDTILYKAMYCGLCKGIAKTCGTRGRFVLNYDLAFLSVLLHNVLGVDVKVEKQRCIIHLTKRPIANVDEITERVASLNVLLAYYKVKDDIVDDNKGRIKRSFIKKAYKKAKKREPIIEQIIAKRYNDLILLEKSNNDGIDIVADPFGMMMQDIVKEIVPNCDENLLSLSYDLGKWIYLIDALDDFDKDIKDGSYNVFALAYPDIKDKCELISKNQSDLVCVFGSVLSNIADKARKIDYKFNHDLIDNVLIRGLSLQTKTIMENNKCKKTTKF